MKVYILGAGPAGLALSDGLREVPGVHLVFLEALPQMGGLAQTVSWGEHGTHDLGPHKLFTTNPALERRVRALLPSEDWLTRPKTSRIYMRGQFLSYPPSPLSLISVYGPVSFAMMTGGYLRAKAAALLDDSPKTTFEEDLRSRVGAGLYRELFKPMALKLWGDPAILDSKLSEGRVQTPSALQLVLRSLGVKRATRSSEALEFFYPRGGLQRVWDAVRTRLGSRAEIFTGHRVTGFEVEGRRLSAIRSRTAQGQERIWPVGSGDFIMSTLPLSSLPALFGEAVETDVGELVRKTIVLNDLLLVFLKLGQERLLKESWVFVPDPSVAFNRVSEQASFDPGMTPGGSIACCEITSHALRPFGAHSDADLQDEAVRGLVAMGYRPKVKAAKVIRLPSSYPVYRAGSLTALSQILEVFDHFENFRTLGRQGSFNYIGSLDAMDIGYGAAAWLAKGGVSLGTSAWGEERLRTAHYSVQD